MFSPTRGIDEPQDGAGIAALFKSLPAEISARILEEAGPHTRLVCRAYRELHPPPLSLTPCFPMATRAAEIQAVLSATCPSTVTRLDLGGLLYSYLMVVDDIRIAAGVAAGLEVAAASLPMLQQLVLPNWSAAPAIISTLHACPQLHTLESLRHGLIDPNFAWGPSLASPPLSTRLRSLAPLPGYAMATLSTAAAGSFCNLTHLALDLPHLPATHELARLAAAAPALRSLNIRANASDGEQLDVDAVRELATLTALTGLTLYFDNGHADDLDRPNPRVAAMLQQLGALTVLRSLTLHTAHPGWAPAEAGWLLGLTQLTCLCVEFSFTDPAEEEAAQQYARNVARVTADVAAGAAWLPALRRLQLAFSGDDDFVHHMHELWFGQGEPGSFFPCLAAATQLHHLCLNSLILPPNGPGLLTSLQHLTSLQVWFSTEDAAGTVPVSLGWVSALTRLQSLMHTGYAGEPGLDGLSRLCRLRTLYLAGGQTMLSPAVVQLLTAVGPQLERLHLFGRDRLHEGLNTVPPLLFERMGRLRELTLSSCHTASTLVEGLLVNHARLPHTLRRCYVHGVSRSVSLSLSRLRCAYPMVVFRLGSGPKEVD